MSDDLFFRPFILGASGKKGVSSPGAAGSSCGSAASGSVGRVGICIIGSSSLQALGHGVFSMLISFGRQLIVLLPAAYLLSQTGNLDLVWYSFPIAEIASLALTTTFLLRVYRRSIRPMIKQEHE